MAVTWPILTFDKAPLVIIDGDRGKNYPRRSEFSDTGYCLFLNTRNVTERGFDFTSCDFITKEKDKLLRKGKLKRCDVILTTRGTVGNTAYYDASVPYDHIRINSGMVIFRADSKVFLPRFFYLFLRSGIFRQQVLSLTTGSAQPQLPIRDIKRVRIPLPPLPEQRAIAYILGTLDDKIELNRQMNATLEAIARAIFKSWFVDFDPVRANQGKLDLALSPDLLAIFPDAFVESELGPIPAGWETGTLGEIAKNLRRNVDPDDLPPCTPYIGLGHMPQKSIALTEWGEAQEVGSTKRQFREGEILFGKLRPYFHKVGVAPVDGICSTDIVVVVPRQPMWYGLSLCHLSSAEFIDYTTAVSTGTKMPRTKWRDIARYEIVVPPKGIAVTFNQLLEPLFGKIRSNILESRTLADLRDTLLPKLISGELRVPSENPIGE